jgi:hypothetical protein
MVTDFLYYVRSIFKAVLILTAVFISINASGFGCSIIWYPIGTSYFIGCLFSSNDNYQLPCVQNGNTI